MQELVIRPQVIRFRRERWLTPGGETLLAALPAWVEGHFGPALKRYVLAQYHQGCRGSRPSSTTSAYAAPSATSSGS